MRRFTLRELDAAARMRADGASYPRIASTLGRRPSAVYKAIEALGRHRLEADTRYTTAVHLWRLADTLGEGENTTANGVDCAKLAEAVRYAARLMLRTSGAHARAIGVQPKTEADLRADAERLAAGLDVDRPTAAVWGWLDDGA